MMSASQAIRRTVSGESVSPVSGGPRAGERLLEEVPPDGDVQSGFGGRGCIVAAGDATFHHGD